MNSISYDNLINDILETRGRFNCGKTYHERHHIIPKCMGGTDDAENLIDLFAKEHFIAHKLLAQENPANEKLIYAWWRMCNSINDLTERYEPTPEEYEEARICFAEAASRRMMGSGNPNYGKPSPNKGKPLTDEHKKKLSEARKGKYTGEQSHMYGKPGYNKGKHLSEETKKKQSEAAKASWTEERRKEQSGENNPMFGKSHTKESREKMSLTQKTKWTDERRLEQSETSKKRNCGETHPNWGKHLQQATREKIRNSLIGVMSGGKNPRAKQVIRLSDGVIYECGKYAAEENKISYGILKRKCRKHDEFMYYEEWLTLQNDYKDKETINAS